MIETLFEEMILRSALQDTAAMQLHHGWLPQFILIPAHLSTLTSSPFSHQPRHQSGRDLFSRQNGCWVAEMRLILIREPIITLPLLLSLMLTTASPLLPVFHYDYISLSPCPKPVSLSVRLCLALPPSVPLGEPGTCLPVCQAISLTEFPVLKCVLFFCVFLNHRVVSSGFTCVFASLSDRHTQEHFCRKGQIAR